MIDETKMASGPIRPGDQLDLLVSKIGSTTVLVLAQQMLTLREWAVQKWCDEVQHRPLGNVHRRSLDDTWRQVIKYSGINPDDIVGPSHDMLLLLNKKD